MASKIDYISQNPSSSSKISFRPRKIRKITETPKLLTPITCFPNPEKPLISSSSAEISIALEHLRISDPLLSTLIDSYQTPIFKSPPNPPFLALSRSILYQQLATKAAETIYKRFTSLCGGESSVLPDTLLSLSAQNLRKIGVSGRKASYLHDLAAKYRDGILSDSLILEMEDAELMRRLCLVKGIGVWSVHMFMIFTLKRLDVLPVGDLGVRKGVKLLYGLKDLPKGLEMEILCEKWKPFRSIGSWYMWRLIEANGNGVLPDRSKV